MLYSQGISDSERQLLALLYLGRKAQDRSKSSKVKQANWKIFNWIIASFLVVILLIASTLNW